MADAAMTTAGVAVYLGITEDAVQEMVRERRIPHIRLSPRKTIYPRAAIDQWLLTESFSSMSTDPPVLGLVSDAPGT